MKRHLSLLITGIAVLALSIFTLAYSYSTSNMAQAAAASKDETVTGTLEVIAECDETDGQILYFLDTGKERLKLKFVSEPKREWKSGMKVTTTGSHRGNELNVDEASIQTANDFATALPNTFGEQKILVLLVNFLDNTQQPWTTTQASNAVFNTANPKSVTNFLQEVSYNQTWATGDVNGWLGMSINSTCDTTQIALAARQSAQRAGVNLSNYSRFIYVYPGVSGCGFSGWANIPGNEIFLNGVLTAEEIEHEIGHSFGLYHAHRLECGGSVIGSNCTITDKGNMVSTLGYAGATGHYYSYYKERLGWLNYGSSPPITTVTQSGTYTISPMSTLDTAPKALKILKSNGSWYYLEYRRAIGFDSFLSFTYPNSNLTTGVVVSMNDQSDGSKGYQLDMTPGTTSWADSALIAGASYSDQSIGLTITTVSVGSAGAVVNISFNSSTPTCVLSSPTVSVSPATVMSLVAGGSATYSMTVTNNNSANCTNNDFDLKAIIPAGWTVASSSPVISVAPGSSISASVQISPPTGQANGIYTVSIGAANAQNGGYAAALPRDLSVFSSLDVTAATDKASYNSGSTVLMTANVFANSSPISGVNVTFTLTKPNGKVVTGSAVTNASGIATFTYRMNKRQDPTGNYSVTASSSLSGAVGSAGTSFVVR